MPEKRAKLKLVREREAAGRTREIFDDLKRALGVPGIPLLYQAYAALPEFLDMHWRAFKPLLATGHFWQLADRLRGEAYTRTHNYFQIGDLCQPLSQMSFSSGAKHQLEEVIELFNYKDAPVLLIASAQLLAFDQAIAKDEQSLALPVEHPRFDEKPVLVDEEVATPMVKRTYEEIKRALGLPALNGDYKAFARWPDFLAEYWKALKPIVNQRHTANSSVHCASPLRPWPKVSPSAMLTSVSTPWRATVSTASRPKPLCAPRASCKTYFRGLY